METITVYPLEDKFAFTYWKISIKWWIVIEKSRQEIEAIISAPHEELPKALAKIKQWYEESKTQDQKFTLTWYSEEINSIIKQYE